MFFCGVFASTRNYLQLRIQSARREHDIEIGGVGSRGSHQPARPVNLRLTQRRLLRSISGQYQPVFGGEALPLGFVVLKNHEWNRLVRQLPRHAAPRAPPPPGPSEFWLAMLCRLASLFSRITNGPGLRATSPATLRPTRPKPQ